MPQVLIPAAYRGPTQGLAVVEVPTGTVRACIEAVEALHPGIMPLVIDVQGQPQRFVKLFINEQQIDGPGALDRSVGELDELEILAAVAGG